MQDLSNNPHIQRLTTLTQELQQSRSLDQTLPAFHRGFEEEDEFLASLFLSTRGLEPNQYRVVSLQLRDQPPDSSFDQASREPGCICCGGRVAEIIARVEPQLLHVVDWSSDPQFGDTLKSARTTRPIRLPIIQNLASIFKSARGE
jgi:hypothetical protein